MSNLLYFDIFSDVKYCTKKFVYITHRVISTVLMQAKVQSTEYICRLKWLTKTISYKSLPVRRYFEIQSSENLLQPGALGPIRFVYCGV